MSVSELFEIQERKELVSKITYLLQYLQFALVICNAIGTPVDSKYVDLCPKFLSMSANHILSASHDKIMIWTYRTSQIKSALNISSSIQDTTTDR